jgi:hypothetical protein
VRRGVTAASADEPAGDVSGSNMSLLSSPLLGERGKIIVARSSEGGTATEDADSSLTPARALPNGCPETVGCLACGCWARCCARGASPR